MKTLVKIEPQYKGNAMNVIPKIKRASYFAIAIPFALALGACGEVHTQQQAGDGIAPPTAAEMNTMASNIFRSARGMEPVKLKVNSLEVSNALALFSSDKSDYVVCIQWEDEQNGTTYSTDRNTGEITGIVAHNGDKYTAYGAFVARRVDGARWETSLFRREGAKIGRLPVREICRR